jgi:hypothetical protein
MHLYHVKFIRDGETKPRVKQFRAGDPGHAFWKCAQKYPGCVFVEGGLKEKPPGGRGNSSISYAPPSTARIEAEPASKADQITFPFFDGCLGKRRLKELTP